MVGSGLLAVLSTAFYYRFLMLAIVCYAITLFVQVGKPQFNRQFVLLLASNDNIPYLFLCFILLNTPSMIGKYNRATTKQQKPNRFCFYLMTCLLFFFFRMITALIIPMFVYSCFHLNSYVIANQATLGAFGPILLPFSQKLQQNQSQVTMMVANMEILNAGLILLSIFTGSGSLITLFFYYYFLKQRYAQSQNTRMMMGQLRMQLDGLATHQYCPSLVAKLYYTIRDFLSR